MSRIYYRMIRNNQVRLLGKTLYNKELSNGCLDGQRFCFIPYSPFYETGLTALWGTEKLSRKLREANEQKLAEEEMHRFLQPFEEENEKILAPDGFFRWNFWRMRE